MLPKRDDGMPRSMLFDHVCYPRVVMSCHIRHHLTMRAVQGRGCLATPDVVQPFVLPKGDDGMPAGVVGPCVLPKRDDGMLSPTWFDRVRCQKAVMACLA